MLLVLETHVLPALALTKELWPGPARSGTDQDFQLPNGVRIELQALDTRARPVDQRLGRWTVHDPLQLAAVRIEDTGRDAADSITASRLIARLGRVSPTPGRPSGFNALLGPRGLGRSSESSAVAVRLHRIDWHVIDGRFSAPYRGDRAEMVSRTPRTSSFLPPLKVA